VTARVAAIVAADAWSMDVLRVVREAGLREWAVGAGFVRSLVWDRLEGRRESTALTDVDVLHFDPAKTRPEADHAIERRLSDRRPDVPWEVRNQARMHLRNGDAPYLSTEDGMRHWLETPTAVAVRLEADDTITVIAPFGVEDLLAKVIRPTPAGLRRRAAFMARVAERGWLHRWRGIRLIEA
jgi:hypothetical protein